MIATLGLLTLIAAVLYVGWILVCTEADYRVNRMVSQALDGDRPDQ